MPPLGFSLPVPPLDILPAVHAKTQKLSDLIGKYTDWDVRIMTAIALAESGGNSKARHRNTDGSIDLGILQVNSVHGFDSNCLLDPECNIDKGHDVWKSQGYQAWSTYNSGAYKLYLGRDATVRTGTQSVAGGVADTAAGAVKAASSGINSVGDFLHWVTDPSTWARLGKGALGSVLIIVGVGGVVLIVANKASSSPAVQGAAVSAAKLVK